MTTAKPSLSDLAHAGAWTHEDVDYPSVAEFMRNFIEDGVGKRWR
jgi:hypothetical protein